MIFLVQITERVGPMCLFYNTSGGIIIGVGYYFYHGCVSRCLDGSKWKAQNLVVGGRLKWRNVLGIITYCLLLIACDVFVYLTLYFSKRAHINAGIIMTFWAMDPLLMAFTDRVIFKQRIEYFHYIGMLAIIACSAVLSLSDYVYSEEKADLSSTASESPTWVAVVIGLITPITFTTF